MTVAVANPIACLDWQTCDRGVVAPLLAAEIKAWRDTFSWDVAEAWSVVEPARQAGQLPGLVARDATGHAVGWTSFVPHRGQLQVMALVADDAATTSALVDGVLTSAESRACDSTLFCVRDHAPGLVAALQRRGFQIDPYRYLVLALEDRARTPHTFDRWHDDLESMAALCRRAYRDHAGVRAFAPGGTPDEWRHYLTTLVEGTGCGWFLPELSLVERAAAGAHTTSGRQIGAAIMLTDLGTGTAHIAQLAVDPERRGRGTGRRMVDAVLDEASRFYDQVTLLVAGSNTAAVGLYEAAGFRDHATFVVARR